LNDEHGRLDVFTAGFGVVVDRAFAWRVDHGDVLPGSVVMSKEKFDFAAVINQMRYLETAFRELGEIVEATFNIKDLEVWNTLLNAHKEQKRKEKYLRRYHRRGERMRRGK
jgi:uncharacterized protein YcbX